MGITMRRHTDISNKNGAVQLSSILLLALPVKRDPMNYIEASRVPAARLLNGTLFVLLACFGCADESPSGSTPAAGNATLAGLENTGVAFAKNLNGRVTTARFGTHSPTNADIEKLATHTTLREIHADGPELGDDGVCLLAQLSAMQVIDIANSKAKGACLAEIAQLKSLYHLALPGCSSLEVETLDSLRDHQTLTYLDLSGSPIGDESVDVICSMSQLQELRLADTGLTNAGIVQIAERMPSLQLLAIGSVGITDEVAASIQSLTELRQLEIGDAAISRSTVEAIAALPLLRVLKLRDCKSLADEEIGLLGTLPSLAELDVSGTRFTGTGFVGYGFPQLALLEANHTLVTDKQVPDFMGLPMLYSLWIKDTQVTEKGVRNVFASNHQTAVAF
jgi:Leucine Rich repeat